MATLDDVLEQFRCGQTSTEDWLYVAGDFDDLTLESTAELGAPFYDEDLDEESDPPGFAERGLHITIDQQTVGACITWGDRLAGKQSNTAAADVIRYYIRFDAWPESLNSPDPPPWENTKARLNRQFCARLGDERDGVVCRRRGCGRGAVPMSAFCRRHHFENIKGEPYPFVD